ncbi:MAG: P-type conjugative transfer ATPase TrbB [Acidaminococcaceae bacterium]|nr:P-type conjugative transfer ATPase TrbB [Acidaminococcaceae bacterium]
MSETADLQSINVLLGDFIVRLMQRDDITDIWINADGLIWYRSHDEGDVQTKEFLSPEKSLAIIRFFAGCDDKIITRDNPEVGLDIPLYDARFQGMIPPIVDKPVFLIRKRAIRIYPLEDYVSNGTLSKSHYDFIRQAIRKRKNILVVGGTGTGKTTFLNAILQSAAEISPNHRFVILQDVKELQCNAVNTLYMYTKQDDGKVTTRFDMTKLLAIAMRCNPDRIVVGEVRNGAAFTMLKSWNTGHPGGACTVHADDAERGLTRIKSLAQEDSDAAGDLKELISEAVNVVIVIRHVELSDGRRSRRINEIIEVNGYDAVNDKYLINYIQ